MWGESSTTCTPWVQPARAHKWTDGATSAGAVSPVAGLTSTRTARCSPSVTSVADLHIVRGGFPTTMPAGCSTYVPTSPWEGSTAGARPVNTDLLCKSTFPCFDGTNPCLWRARCLEYFNRFNISKCMWVVAATMHMEGKAKVWYGAYRLRQAVGDWYEFMDNVESHFGDADFPPLTPILGTAHPSVNVHASEDIRLATTTRCLDESPKEVMDKVTESTKLTLSQLTERLKVQIAQLQVAVNTLGNVTQMAEPTAANYEEALTHVEGVSLFLEPCVELAEVVFAELHQMEIEDDVFTVIGGLSIFLELVVQSKDGILMASNLKDVEEPPDVSEHEGAYMQQLLSCDASLGDIAHMVVPLAKEYSHDVLTHVGSSSLLLEQGSNVADMLFDALLLKDVSRSEAVSAYIRNTFDPGIVTVSVEFWVLEFSSPLQCHGFIPGSTIAKSEHPLCGSSRDHLSVPGDPRVWHLILCGASVWKTYLTNLWRCGQRGMIFADQEKMSDAYETTRESKKCMVTEHQRMVTHTLFTDCCISVWLQSIQVSVHLYMHFSTVYWSFRFSTWLKLLYGSWSNGGPHCSLYVHLVYAPLRQPSQLQDQGARVPFYQGCVFDEVPHLRSAIIPEGSARHGYHFSLEYIPPWQRNAFSPGPNTLVNCQEQHLALGDLQVKNQITVQIFTPESSRAATGCDRGAPPLGLQEPHLAPSRAATDGAAIATARCGARRGLQVLFPQHASSNSPSDNTYFRPCWAGRRSSAAPALLADVTNCRVK